MLDVIERIEAREKKERDRIRIEGKREGIIEGIIEGKIEGKIENTIEIAKKMIKEGFDINLIYTITGLQKRKIEELKRG